jgi:hypothetical protein
MIGYLLGPIVRYLPSPYGIALVPCFLFLFAWTFPPDLYIHYISEPDLMYHNLTAMWFFTACVAAFFLGVRVIGRFDSAPPEATAPSIQLRSSSKLLYLIVPLLLAAGPCLIYLLLIARNVNFLALVLSQQGDVIKQAMANDDASSFWDSGLFLLTGVLWWAAYRAGQLKLNGAARKTFYLIFLGCFALNVITCLATFDRTNLMPLLGGCTVIYLFFKTRAANLKLGRLALIGVGSIVVMAGSFAALQFARGASAIESFISSMLGYSIVSYNRLAALLMGVLHYVYQGKGAYVVAFLTTNGRFSGIRDQMGLPSSYEVWLSEFLSVSASGLNAGYNWAGVFGYLFSDIGWWTPLYMFGTGVLGGYLWSRFRAGASIGIVCYPWMAFWILFWFGWNLLFDARGEVLLETGILLFIYDRICLLSVRDVSRTPRDSGSVWEPGRPVASTHRGGLF